MKAVAFFYYGRKVTDHLLIQENVSQFPWSPCMDFWPSMIIEAEPLLRKAADGEFYTHEEFVLWYHCKFFAEMRWEQAATHDHLGNKMMRIIYKQGCPSCGSWNVDISGSRNLSQNWYSRACPSCGESTMVLDASRWLRLRR